MTLKVQLDMTLWRNIASNIHILRSFITQYFQVLVDVTRNLILNSQCGYHLSLYIFSCEDTYEINGYCGIRHDQLSSNGGPETAHSHWIRFSRISEEFKVSFCTLIAADVS